MRSKKAQVTIFVIIGIVLLIGAGLFIFLRGDVQNETQTVEEFTSGVTQVDANFQSVQSYVQNCIQSVGTRGLQYLGEGGGYIRPLDPDALYYRIYNEADIYASEGVLLSPANEDTFVPYWYHSINKPEAPTILPELSIPTMDMIVEQLQYYVDQEVQHCIDNFTALEFAGVKISVEQEPLTQVLFTDENVLLKTAMRTTIELPDGQTTVIENYLAAVEIPFTKYYTKAQLIAAREMDYNFLENLVVDLISYYGRIDYDAIPPIAMTSFSEYTVIWNQEQVNQRLRSLLQSYVPLFRVANTKNGYILEVEGSAIEEAFYNSFLLPILETYNPDLEVSFIYLNWPIYSKVFPTDGTTITPGIALMGEGFQFYGPEQNNNYQFFYDVTYPVIVELREENLPNGEDYTFMFALEANLKKNKNWKDYATGRGPLEWDHADYTLELENAVEEVEDPLTQQTYEVQTTPPAKILFGDGQQQISGNITLYTYDKESGASLEQVSVSVGVGTYAKSFLGHTELTERHLAKFQGRAPAFENGYLILKKTGYATHYEPISIGAGEEKGLGSIGMLREQDQEIHLRVLEYFGSDDLPATAIGSTIGLGGDDDEDEGYFAYREMGLNESVFVTFTKVQSRTDPTPYTQVAVFEPRKTTQNITLIPGKYTLQANLIDNLGVIIPEKSKRICEGFIECLAIDDDDEWIPEDPVEIKPAMWGGIMFTEKQPWRLAGDDLYTDNLMELTVLKFPPPTSFDSMQAVADLETYTIKYKPLLLPNMTIPELT